jgi:hypothetical protein
MGAGNVVKVRFAHDLCAFGGGSSLRKDDGDEHSTMLLTAVSNNAATISNQLIFII